jgi:hypothetical protein
MRFCTIFMLLLTLRARARRLPKVGLWLEEAHPRLLLRQCGRAHSMCSNEGPSHDKGSIIWEIAERTYRAFPLSALQQIPGVRPGLMMGVWSMKRMRGK